MKQTAHGSVGRTPTAIVVVLLATHGARAPAAVDEAPSCAAAVPVPNPWTRGCPEGWWMKRHAETLVAPARPRARIAFIGDSITDGWDSEKGGLEVWEEEFAPLGALNLGINCDSTQHVLWRILNGAVDGLPKLEVVVLEIGVNNKGISRHSEEDIGSGIAAICEALKRRVPQARILLMGVFPRFWGRDNSTRLNGRLAGLDDGRQVFFLNINRELTETEGAIGDAVGHLSEKGYRIWADATRDAVESLIAGDVRGYLARRASPRESTAAEPRPAGGDANGPRVRTCRATTPVPNPRSPRWYSKNFNIIVWGRRFERRRAELAFLGSSATYHMPRALWDREYAPLKGYNLGMPDDCTEHVLWRIDNGAVDVGWSALKLLVLQVGVENRTIHRDGPEDIAAGIEAVCGRIRARVPHAKILLMGLFPPLSADDRHDEVNALVARLADGKHVFFLDINDALLETPGALGRDGGALTSEGYDVWIERMRPMIDRLMGASHRGAGRPDGYR